LDYQKIAVYTDAFNLELYLVRSNIILRNLFVRVIDLGIRILMN